ncbi:MAG: hypothetical protein M0R46_02990 [Candidatus Muirbacterium halophilum]|nr:hypothetical protein [Candidatus Muirbacterium halophilum]MCK9474857.1 hypothetical protein [Candidatus Muirbacterium halophilum]
MEKYEIRIIPESQWSVETPEKIREDLDAEFIKETVIRLEDSENSNKLKELYSLYEYLRRQNAVNSTEMLDYLKSVCKNENYDFFKALILIMDRYNNEQTASKKPIYNIEKANEIFEYYMSRQNEMQIPACFAEALLYGKIDIEKQKQIYEKIAEKFPEYIEYAELGKMINLYNSCKYQDLLNRIDRINIKNSNIRQNIKELRKDAERIINSSDFRVKKALRFLKDSEVVK